MAKYVCHGSCAGESDHPGTCQAESCERHHMPLELVADDEDTMDDIDEDLEDMDDLDDDEEDDDDMDEDM